MPNIWANSHIIAQHMAYSPSKMLRGEYRLTNALAKKRNTPHRITAHLFSQGYRPAATLVSVNAKYPPQTAGADRSSSYPSALRIIWTRVSSTSMPPPIDAIAIDARQQPRYCGEYGMPLDAQRDCA